MVSEHNCDECEGECNCGDFEENLENQIPHQFDKETQAAIQEIQILEQNFEQLMHQKHLFNMESSETDLAIKEVEKSDGEVFKLVGGQVIIKTSKDKLLVDLNKKKELIEVRMKSIESQEKEFTERMEQLRKEILSRISPRE